MAGSKSYRKIQLGRESVSGTPVAATTIWRGLGALEDTRVLTFPKEDVGIFSGIDRTYVPQLGAKLAMEAIPANFEQFPYLLEASVKAVATGAADGSGGSGYKYVYALPTTVKNTINTYTLQAGDDQEAEVAEYCFVTDWKLSGSGPSALMMSGTWVGRQVALQAYTGALAIPSIEDILFLKGKLWIDAVGGTIGTTLAANTFLGVEIDFKSGWVPVFTADGALYFSFTKATEPELTATVTFEHDTVGAARKVDWRAQTARLIRLQWDGNAYATPGTGTLNTAKKTLRIDGVSKISNVSKLGERNGNDILTVKLNYRYNVAAAIPAATITVTNELSALP